MIAGVTAKLKVAYLLADASHAALPAKPTADDVEVTLPAHATDPTATIVVLEIEK